jgi:hypothetical protein
MTESNLKPKAECEGDRDRCTLGDECPKYGTLGRVARDGKRRIAGCGDPVARGKRNRAKGDSKARRARKQLGITGVNSRHEEHWGGEVRVEIKAGKQVSPIWTRFKLAEAQSDAARAIADNRPFVMVAMPDDIRDGLVLCRLSQVQAVAAAVLEMGLGE